MYESDSPRTIRPFVQKATIVAETVQPAGKAEFARIIVLLFTSVRNCHSAYLRWKSAPTGENLQIWRQAVAALDSVLTTLSLSLHILAPDVFENVAYYMDLESTAYRRVDTSLGQLTHLGGYYYDDVHEGTDFTDILSGLSEFIRSNFTMEEIFEASTR